MDEAGYLDTGNNTIHGDGGRSSDRFDWRSSDSGIFHRGDSSQENPSSPGFDFDGGYISDVQFFAIPRIYENTTTVGVGDNNASVAFQGLLRNAAPLPFHEGPVVHNGVYMTPAGPIRVEIDHSSRSITNFTLPGHVFYPGTVTRSIEVEFGMISVRTLGTGAGFFGDFNEWLGSWAWNGLDANIAGYVRTHGNMPSGPGLISAPPPSDPGLTVVGG